MTLSTYIHRRLGPSKETRVLLKENFRRSFTAPTLGTFWRYWNPVYGYYLAKYVHAPLRRFLPAPACVVLTFAFSGFFLHDIFSFPIVWWVRGRPPVPETATWFVFIALAVLLTERLGIRFDRLSSRMRVLVHTAVLAGTHGLALLVAH